MERVQLFLAWLMSYGEDRDEDGQTMIEYGLIVALISIAIMASFFDLAGSGIQ